MIDCLTVLHFGNEYNGSNVYAVPVSSLIYRLFMKLKVVIYNADRFYGVGWGGVVVLRLPRQYGCDGGGLHAHASRQSSRYKRLHCLHSETGREEF